MAFALYGIAVVVAPAIGPTLGGWITDNYSWHWIFLINVPVGVGSLRNLLASQDALANSDGDVAVRLVALYKALGGGWELDAAKATVARP